MIGNAVSIRLSRRIRRKASLLPVKVPIKKKIRRPVVKKRISSANSSLLKAKESTIFGRKSKLEKNPKTPDINSALYKVTGKAQIVQKSKLGKYSKQTSEKSSHNLKPTNKKSIKNLPEIFDQKRKKRSSLKSSRVYLTDEVKQQNLKIKLSKGKKRCVAKKNLNESTSNSLTISKSSLIAEDKQTSKKLDNSKLKLSRVKKHTEKRCSLLVTDNGPKTGCSQNRGKSSQTSRHSKTKKSAQLSAESEISLNLSKSESLSVTHHPDKATCLTRQREDKKSANSSKGFNRSMVKNSGISSNTSGFQSILKTPNLEKLSEKRKSLRLSRVDQLKTLKKVQSLSTSALKKSQDSMLNESCHSSKSAENNVRKRGRPTISKKEIPDKVTRQEKSTQNWKSKISSKRPNHSKSLCFGISLSVSQSILETPHPENDSKRRKSARLSKESSQSRMSSSKISLNSSRFQSILETPHPRKQTEKRKPSRVLEPNLLTTLNKEESLLTPSSLLKKNQNTMSNKSSRISSSTDSPVAENRIRKRGRLRISNKEISTGSFVKPKSNQGQPVKQKKSLENFKLPLSKVTDNLPLDVLSTPAFTTICVKSKSEKCLLKPGFKSSKRKFHRSATENHFASEELHNATKRKKSTGDNICLDNSACPSKNRTMKRSKSVKTNSKKNLKENQSSENHPMPGMDIQCKTDDLTSVFQEKPFQRRTRSVSNKNKISCLATVVKRKNKSADFHEREKEKKAEPPIQPRNEYDASCSDTDSENETLLPKIDITKRQKTSTPIVNCKNNLEEKSDFLSPYVVKRRANTVSSKADGFHELFIDKGASSAYQKQRMIKTLTPIPFASISGKKSRLFNSLGKRPLPIDDLTGSKGALSPQSDGEGLFTNKSTSYKGRKKIHSWPLGKGISSKISAKEDFPNCRGKGTLKHKRWLLNHLKESNVGYEDDIFENQSFDHYKNFHFGEESDGSSVNIATPKFDCILTPALPKKTPRFKDCISPTELLQARKTAEEYLYRRNKKRKSGDMPPSGKNTSTNTKNATEDVPEKKKLDFGETVNKLIEVQKILEKDAEIGDEDEDSYFSDASN